MLRRSVIALVVLFGGLVPHATAQNNLERALAEIPGDATAFVCLPSLKSLDANAQAIIQRLGLEAMVPLPDNSLRELIKQRVPSLKGMDDSGPLAVILMSGEGGAETKLELALLMATKEPKELLQAMNGEPQDDGLWSAELFGRPATAIVRDDFVIVGPKKNVLEKIKNSDTSVAKKLSAPIRSALAGLDVVAWVNAEQLVNAVKPAIEEKLYPLMDAQAQSDWEKKSNKLSKQQLEVLLDGSEQILVGLMIQPTGLALRTVTTVRPNSELDELTELSVTDEPLLRGLGQDPYAIAMAQTADQKQMEVQFKNTSKYFELLEDVQDIDAKKLGQLKDCLRDWSRLLRGYRATVVPLEPNAHGLIGITIVAEMTDSNEWLELTQTGLNVVGELVSAAGDDIDEDVQEMFEALTFEPSDEKIADVSVRHLRIDLEKLRQVDEDVRDQLSAVLGEEELLVRVAAIDAETVLLVLGGGPQRFEKLVGQARNAEVSLDEHPGIRQVAEHLPQQRNSVIFVDLDAGLQLGQQILEALDEDALPFSLPEIEVPIAMTVTGGGTWTQFDLFVPMEVVSAGRDITMTLMGAPAGN